MKIKNKFIDKQNSLGKTFLGKTIPEDTRGILYLCKYDNEENTILVFYEMFFTCTFKALTWYAEVRNPESQLMTGKTYEDLIKKVDQMKKNLVNPSWLKELSESL